MHPCLLHPHRDGYRKRIAWKGSITPEWTMHIAPT